MKFSLKIFIISYLVVILSFGFGGFILLNSFFIESLKSAQATLEQSNYNISNSYHIIANDPLLKSQIFLDNYKNSVVYSKEDSKLSIGNIDEINPYREIHNMALSLDTSHNERGSMLYNKDGRMIYEIVSSAKINSEDVYIDSLQDITGVFETRDNNYRTFRFIMICVAVFSAGFLSFASSRLTKPLKKLDTAAKGIGSGNFNNRVILHQNVFSSSQEVNNLMDDFNIMADHLEKHIVLLKEETRKRDDFIANFTHEFKTPLTSVIGYSDLLRSFDLSPEKRRTYADAIYKEGSRLESLGSNLMELIVLDKNSIEFEEKSSEEIFLQTKAAVDFILQKYGVTLETDYERTFIHVNPVLLKTILYNLIDNSCKNGSKNILLTGSIKNDSYCFSVTDDGYGIPKDKIDKVTEEFYMVDKSRARSSGGAGIGLSLCKRIAEIHDSTLTITSELKFGTCVSFSVKITDEKDGVKNE